jgi:hypothetical protein
MRRFQNEIGNSIELEVVEKEISEVPGILISLSGPTSDTDLHITREEAKVLIEELERVIDEP